MNAQQLSRRHVMQLAAGALASAGLVRGSLAASGSDTRAKAIIIYFSRTGTTKGLAEAAAAATGADLLELTLKDPYADDYSAMTGIARSERANNARREIAAAIPDLSGYDVVVIGSPYWWGGLSIPMRTFLMDHPLAGKRVLCFGKFVALRCMGRCAHFLSECSDCRRLSHDGKPCSLEPR